LLRLAGNRLRGHYGRVKTIQYKGGAATNLVTNADQDVELYIKRKIQKQFPTDAILAEESEIENARAPRRWIIDPLDGTTNFAHSFPFFSISIGVEIEGEIVLGGVYNPIQEEFFFAKKGGGSRLNGKRIHVSETTALERSMLATGFPYTVHEHPEQSLPYFNAMIRRAQAVRRNGSASLDLCHLAMGRYDGFFEVELNPWDTAAGVLILKEAGGMVTNFDGQTYSIYGKDLTASNGRIHRQMTEILHQIKSGKRREMAL
jgi:myo-inositol-1(or 4)-monophosphatase